MSDCYNYYYKLLNTALFLYTYFPSSACDSCDFVKKNEGVSICFNVLLGPVSCSPDYESIIRDK